MVCISQNKTQSPHGGSDTATRRETAVLADYMLLVRGFSLGYKLNSWLCETEAAESSKEPCFWKR
jgi:hypothetical protein